MVATVTIASVYSPQIASDKNVKSAEKDITALRVSGDRKGQAMALLALAHAYLGVDSPEDAFQAATDALPLNKEQGNKEGEAIAKLFMVKARCAADRAAEAVPILQEAKQLLEANKKGSAACTLMGAGVKLGTSSYSEAKELATQAISGFKEAGDVTGQAASQLELAKISLAMGLNLDAIKAGEASATLFISGKDTLGEATAKVYITKGYAAKKNLKKVVEYAGEVTKAAQDLKVGQLEVDVLKAQVDVHIANKKPDLAIELLEKAKVAFKNKSDNKSAAAVMLMLHHMYMENDEDFDKALELCKDAVALYQQVAYQKGELDATMAAAECHFQMSQMEDACSMAKEAVEIAREIGMTTGEQDMLSFLVDTYDMCGAIDEASGVVNDATDAYKGSGEIIEARVLIESAYVSTGLAMNQAMRGDIGGAMGTLDTAWNVFKTARDIAIKKQDLTTAGMAMQGHAYSKAKANMFEDAVQSLSEAVRYLKEGTDNKKLAYGFTQQADIEFTRMQASQGDKARPEAALTAAKQAYQLFSELEDTNAEISALNTVANLYISYGDGEAAWRSAMAAVLASSDKGSKAAKPTANLMLAGAHLKLGNYYDARDTGYKAMRLFNEMGDVGGESTAKEFVDGIDAYESGHFSNRDFGGFVMGKAAKPGPSRFPRRLPKPKAAAAAETEPGEKAKKKKKKGGGDQNLDVTVFDEGRAFGSSNYEVDRLESRIATGSASKVKKKEGAKADPFAFNAIQPRSESEQGRLKNLAGLG